MHRRFSPRQWITLRLRAFRAAFHRFVRHSYMLIKALSQLMTIITDIAAVACIICMVIHVGYDHTASEFHTIYRVMRIVKWVFITSVVFDLTLNIYSTVRNSRSVKWIVDIGVILLLLTSVFPPPSHHIFRWVTVIFYSTNFLYAILTAFALVTLTYEIFKLVDRRTNPSLLLSMSFVVFIVIGTMLLMLPRATYSGISFVDSLFVSTSAVCVTGLTPIDVSSTFTPLGLTILAVLIQVGALGVMTFTSFFALFFSGSASIYSQLMLRDVIYSRTMASLIPTLLYILGATLSIEAVGAALIFLSIHGSLGMNVTQELTFSAFHSLSAFCNAGFSTLPGGMSNPMLLYHNTSIYWIMTLLIVVGSTGFPILVNLKDVIHQPLRRFNRRMRHRHLPPATVHQFNMNTKIVIFTSGLLLVAGAVLFFVLEYNNSLTELTLWQKVTAAVFNSAVPRSAGFASVNPAGFLNVTLVMVIFLMWIGGGSQSTGGGIKVNTFAAIWLNLRAIVTNAPRVTAFRRTIAVGSIRRANAVVAISIISYFTLSFLLLGLEPQLSARDVLFESCSALFTVGSSLGITGLLSVPSKILLCCAMFLGRVGIISLLMGVVRSRHSSAPDYPSDNIIIN